MDIVRSTLLRRIFDEAAERPEAQRAEFIRRECVGDAAMEQEVLALLSALEHRSAALEMDPGTWMIESASISRGPTAREHTEQAATATESSGGAGLHATTMSDFRLGKLIGRGAIGSVYEAEQISLKRQVAVKLLQSWSATREARRRFIQESAILARLKHPGIAQVIAAGTRELNLSGPDPLLAAGLFSDLHSVPWIAMELVEGARTIVEHCRGNALSHPDILRLFAEICDAVHHGHQQGVIHRDLKPANILVNTRGEVKVIDFGVAKAIDAGIVGLNQSSAQTEHGGLFGSLRYMSPEQCVADRGPVDTRSDVYSIGLVLFESLTGSFPYELDETSVLSAANVICESTPVDPRGLDRSLTADAAAVLLKALQKDPILRYQSPAEMAADLRRVIAHEPVLARRPSVVYSFRMFVRRRPAAAALLVVATLALLTGISGIILGLASERVGREQAERAAWLANLTAAESSLRLGDGGGAMRRLKAVPDARRGWEWRYLHACADTSASSWQINAKREGVFLSHTGRYAYCYNVSGPERRADIIDTTTRQVIVSIEDGMPSGTVAWNKDESLLVLPQAKGLVLLNAKTGELVRNWPPWPKGGSLGAEFSPDGSLIAVGLSEFAGVVVYDLHSGETVFAKTSEAWVFHPAFSPDGKELAWSDVTTVESVDTATWTRRRSVATSRLTSFEPGNLAYSPDGKLVAVVCGMTVQVIDVDSWTVRQTLRGHLQRVHFVAFDDSSTRLVTTSIDRTVRIWNAQSGEQIITLLGHESPTQHARFISGALPGQPDVISVDTATRVRTWNLDGNGPQNSAQAADRTRFFGQLDFSPDSRVLRAVGDQTVVTFDLSDRHAARLNTLVPSTALNVVPRADLMIRNLDTQVVAIESLRDHSRLWTRDDERVLGFVVSPDGSSVGIIRDGFAVSIHRVLDGVELGRTVRDPSHLERLVFSPDAKSLATVNERGVLRLFDATTGAFKEEIAGEGERGVGICWSNGGEVLAFAHAREGVTVLDMGTRKPITVIEGVGGTVWSIAISPDRTRMAVGAQDRVTHIYELPSGDALLQLREHTGTVMSVAWSPDGRFLASGGYDKRVFVYDGAFQQTHSDRGVRLNQGDTK